MGDIGELLQKLDASCFTYQHVEFLYTISSIDFVLEVLPRVDKSLMLCRKQLTSIKESKELTENPESRKKTLSEKALKALIELLTKNKINSN